MIIVNPELIPRSSEHIDYLISQLNYVKSALADAEKLILEISDSPDESMLEIRKQVDLIQQEADTLSSILSEIKTLITVI